MTKEEMQRDSASLLGQFFSVLRDFNEIEANFRLYENQHVRFYACYQAVEGRAKEIGGCAGTTLKYLLKPREEELTAAKKKVEWAAKRLLYWYDELQKYGFPVAPEVIEAARAFL